MNEIPNPLQRSYGSYASRDQKFARVMEDLTNKVEQCAEVALQRAEHDSCFPITAEAQDKIVDITKQKTILLNIVYLLCQIELSSPGNINMYGKEQTIYFIKTCGTLNIFKNHDVPSYNLINELNFRLKHCFRLIETYKNITYNNWSDDQEEDYTYFKTFQQKLDICQRDYVIKPKKNYKEFF